MPQEFTAAEISEADREALEEARDDEYLYAHVREKSLPWYLCDILFRPRLAVLRWTRDTDDRLRDRATGIMTLVWFAGVLAVVASPAFPRMWQESAGVVAFFVAAFFLNNVALAAWAKAYDVAGSQLGGAESFDRLRVVLALSWIPLLVVVFPGSMLRLWFRGVDMSKTDFTFSPSGFEILVYGLALGWSMVFTLRAIKALQHFSTARALANQAIGAIYMFLFTFGLLFAFVVVYSTIKGRWTLPVFF